MSFEPPLLPHRSISIYYSYYTMKSFLAILALAFLATASAQDACAECQGHVTDLLTYLTTPDEIAEEIALLKAVVCPTMPV